MRDLIETSYERTFGMFLGGGHFLGWPALAVALVIAIIVIYRRQTSRGRRGFSPRQMMIALFPKRVFLHRSAVNDYAFVLFNQGVLAFVTASLVLSSSFVAGGLYGLVADAGHPPMSRGEGVMVRLIYTVYLVLLWDFGATFAHYLKHKWPLMWEFHKIHHSAEVLTPITALRRHPVEALFGSAIVAITLGLGAVIWIVAFGALVSPVTMFGGLAGVFLWRVLGYNLRHSHLWISYGRIWNQILISPAHHQIHHSDDQRHYDTNFGHIFTFWDRLFGTHYIPAEEERVAFGIDAEEMPDYQTLCGLYFTPFVKIARRFSPLKPKE
jgi:sterol desaturase/sphingolipid hydroxylase (fatty acid hydroxylase superfamily)